MTGRTNKSRWLRDNIYHIVFGIALFCLVMLGSWWMIFIGRAITKHYEFRVSTLQQSQRFIALNYESAPTRPETGTISVDDRFRFRRCDSLEPSDAWAMRLQTWTDICLVLDGSVLEAVEKKHKRQKLMVYGEGTLLFFLLAISIFMLWRFYGAEKRFVHELERFIEILTHRLKGPSTGLSVLLETMKMGKIKGSEMTEMIELAQIELERQHQIINNILMACRERDEPWRVNVSSVSLKSVVDTILIRWEKLMGSDNFSVDSKVNERDLVLADENALRIALENVIDNAFKYSKSGEVDIRIESEKTGDGKLNLIVADKGIGITPENMDKLFEPFWRGRSSDRGSGLGLYISRRIIRQMGGELSVESEGEGKGTTITVALSRPND